MGDRVAWAGVLGRGHSVTAPLLGAGKSPPLPGKAEGRSCKLGEPLRPAGRASSASAGSHGFSSEQPTCQRGMLWGHLCRSPPKSNGAGV